MGKCEYLIAQAITENCDDPLVKGLEKRGIIINRDDVDFGAVEFAADQVQRRIGFAASERPRRRLKSTSRATRRSPAPIRRWQPVRTGIRSRIRS